MSLSINLRSLARSNNVTSKLYFASFIKHASTSSNFLNYDKDPSASFFNADNQKLMKSITRLQLEKVFRRKTVPKNTVEFKFLTSKQLEDEVRNKFIEAERILQMPPIVNQMEEKLKVIGNDPALKDFSPNSFVFTDVTFGLRNSERSVVIRHPSGVLEEAPFDVRKRVSQIYFPAQGRMFREPAMFEEQNLKRLLEAAEYEFVLNRTVLQFEPFEPKFHQITAQVYQTVNNQLHFDHLRSTRHFGPMAFFLAWHKIIDDMLLDMIRNDFLSNAVELICLMFKLNEIQADMNILKTLETRNNLERRVKLVLQAMLSKDQSTTKKIEKSDEDLRIDELCFEFIQESFVKTHALKRPQLELALQTYKERHNELKDIAQGVN